MRPHITSSSRIRYIHSLCDKSRCPSPLWCLENVDSGTVELLHRDRYRCRHKFIFARLESYRHRATEWIIEYHVLRKSIVIGHRLEICGGIYFSTSKSSQKKRFSLTQNPQVFQAIGQAAVMLTASPYIAISYPFLGLLLYIVQRFYLRTSRQLRLLDLEANSPL